MDAMPNLGARLGRVRLYVKRDDCTGLAFGGNKVRQLEFYLGEAVARNADTVLITGAVQSNFVRLAAAAAASPHHVDRHSPVLNGKPWQRRQVDDYYRARPPDPRANRHPTSVGCARRGDLRRRPVMPSE
ncbi:MAG: hypothetical protein IH900_14800 [Proteobacteria bacterium]|nr:hypothetical protein [Pseudomonadota bacterium]